MIPLLVAMALQPASPPQIPAGAGMPLLRYFACLGEGSRPQIVPPTTGERQALVATILAECRTVRHQAASASFEALATDDAFPDSSARRDAVESWLTHFESGLRRRIVERERFIEETAAYEACLDRGENEC